MQKDRNAFISALECPDDLKETDVIPVQKKKYKLSKEDLGQ